MRLAAFNFKVFLLDGFAMNLLYFQTATYVFFECLEYNVSQKNILILQTLCVEVFTRI